MFTTKEIKVPLPWGEIRGQIFENGDSKTKTPIIAVHGYLDNSNSFRPLAPYLCEKEFYLIAIDLPGHGFSSRMPTGVPYTPKLFLSALRHVILHFNLKKFIFLSHSYGSGLSLLVSYKNNQQSSSLSMLTSFSFVI
jgi:pimeloyl-ACP methyl ester carboxylesterase